MGRWLGVDYGEKRVGLAVSDESGILATPLRIADVLSVKQAARAVREACAEVEAVGIVVGMPLNMNGTIGFKAEEVNTFCERLRRSVNVPVETWDERLSTSMVERVLLEADMSRGKRRKVRDKLAAQVILQGWLDARQNELERDE
ncbi:MAG: Holliday junction resolvase RuvX [Kiritimatiellae bacterium]|nr:Holliday junction resolvase RuvX [Kiritimatiellia bacterium]